MIVAIIPARHGSQGIPGKNMIDLGGRPLLDYTLSTAVECRRFDRIALSTNMPEAIDWAQRHYRRIEVPFIRPEELSGSNASSVDVVLHAIDFLEQRDGVRIQTVVLLQPTCPFREAREVDQAIDLFVTRKLSSLIGVSRVWHHPSDYVYRKANDSSGFEYVLRRPEWQQRQDFPEVWFITGALYICTTERLRTTRTFLMDDSHLFPMGDPTMVDIDLPFDLAIARGLVAIHAIEPANVRAPSG